MPEIADIEAQLAAREAQVPHLRQGCEKRIIWADDPGKKTAVSVVYLHGFSATGEEVRPLPDLIAKALGANLFFTRLDGHGQDGAALGATTLQAWRDDTSEAIEIGHALGDKVIVIGCSTGCTLATLAIADGAQIDAVVHLSPNFGLRHRAVQTLLDMPAARQWADYVAGSKRSFQPRNAAHAAYWTLEYPTAAVHVMADTVRAAKRSDLEKIATPALFCFNERDQVVNADEIRCAAKRWGGPVQIITLDQTPDDDPMGHIMAGDIMSPGQTAPLAQRILAWVRALP